MTIVSRIKTPVPQMEFDVFGIAQILWRRRILILAVTLFITAIAAMYAFLSPAVYQATTVLRPPALNDLDAINRSLVYSLPPKEALMRVGASLESYQTRFDFFKQHPELVLAYKTDDKTIEQAFEKFNQSLRFVQSDSKKDKSLRQNLGISFNYEEGIDGVGILNKLVAFAIENERFQIENDLKIIIGNRIGEVDAKLKTAVAEYSAQKESSIAKLEEGDAIRKAQLQDELKAIRVQLKLRREARLAQLKEAISIARSLGIRKPATPSSMADDVGSAGNVIKTEVYNQQIPLYFMGYEVLEAERDVLRKRTSDDFTEPRIADIRKKLLMLEANRKIEMLKARENEMLFLEGVESLRAEDARLKNIRTDLKALRIVDVDQFAVSNPDPIRPKKGLIITLGFLFGLIIGLFIALCRGVFKLRMQYVPQVDLDSRALSKTIAAEQLV